MSNHGEPEDNLDYWQIDLDDGGGFKVSEAEGRSVQQQLQDGIVEWVTFTDLSGSPVFYRAQAIYGIYASTIENRDWERRWIKVRKAEDPIE